jgi:hypothetical protein
MLRRAVNVLVKVNDAVLRPPRAGLQAGLGNILVCCRGTLLQRTTPNDQPGHDVSS